MSFLKQIVLPNGVTGGFHKVIKIETLENCTKLQAQVGSWPTYEDYARGIGANWNQYIEVPMYDLYTKTETYLNTTDQFNGSIIMEDLDSLSVNKVKKWWELKTERDRREYAGFVWDNSVFDSDTVSQGRIQGAVQLAIIAQQANQPFSINWTLKDNSARMLNGTEMVQVGMALAQHVQTLHETARILRAQVDSAENDQQLAAINWPT